MDLLLSLSPEDARAATRCIVKVQVQRNNGGFVSGVLRRQGKEKKKKKVWFEQKLLCKLRRNAKCFKRF